MERKDSLKILHSLISKNRVDRRSKNLIFNPEAGSDGHWFVDVPACFYDALDVKFNCGTPNPGWTQAGCFAFKAQDTFYDSPEARSLVWFEALKTIKFVIVVQSATSAGVAENNRRFSGQVYFKILRPNSIRNKMIETNEHTMTQDHFVEFLINGNLEEVQNFPLISETT
jgi:hypothetical protein